MQFANVSRLISTLRDQYDFIGDTKLFNTPFLIITN